jgi:hypothetical protein
MRGNQGFLLRHLKSFEVIVVSKPKPPTGTGPGGTRLWRQVTESFDLDGHELVILRQAVDVLDSCELLQAAVRAEGLLDEERAVHPAARELRLQRVLLLRVLADLRFPDPGEVERPQRRSGSRGAYGRREST